MRFISGSKEHAGGLTAHGEASSLVKKLIPVSLLIILALSLWKLSVLIKDYNDTKSALKSSQATLSEIKQEKTMLESRLETVNADLKGARAKIAELELAVSLTRADKEALEAEKGRLLERVSLLENEKSILVAKLTSIEELKKLIQAAYRSAYEEKIRLQKERDAIKSSVGNHGFIKSKGKWTYRSASELRSIGL